MKNFVTFFCLLSFRVTFSTTTIQKGYVRTSLGCFVDASNDNDRVLTDHGKFVPLITIEECEKICLIAQNISRSLYFGLEEDRMCYCGRKESNYGRYGPSNNCTVPCRGNETQICGGHQAISVYQLTLSPCGQMIPPVNGYVNLNVNDTASIGCLDDYQLRGSKLIQCNVSSSEWDIPVTPSCIRKTGKCEKLENPMNGTIHQDYKQANFSCDQSYVLDGDSVLYCLPTGNWSTEPPDCIPEQYLTTMIATIFDMTTDTGNSRVLGLPIHIFTSLLLVAAAVLVVVIVILINLIVKTTTETKRIKKFKTDSTYAEQRSRGQENNESFWKSSPDMLKTSKSVDN